MAAPLEGASVSLLWSDSDSLLTTTSAAPGGSFEVRAPRARFDVLARRIGFAARRQSLDLTSQSGDTVVLTIHLDHWNLALEAQIAELQRPTEVTPCRPANSTAFRVAELIRDMLAPEDSTILRQMGVGDLAGVSVEHVIDGELCRAATDAMGRAHDIPGEGMQVHLYRLGDRGWAAYEASFIGSHYSSLYLLDPELTRVREVFAF